MRNLLESTLLGVKKVELATMWDLSTVARDGRNSDVPRFDATGRANYGEEAR